MDRLAVIAAESERFAEVLSGVKPDTPCPTCPEWSAADLLWHLVNVHVFWAGILGRGVLDATELEAVEAAKPARPDTVEAMLPLRAEATAALLDQLERRSDDELCWSWWPADQTVGFTRRMQTYEATMHRVDAELAAGAPVTPLVPDVAAGAIDHAVDVMWGWMPDDAAWRPGGVVEFVADDAGERWNVEVGEWVHHDGSTGGPRAVRSGGGSPTASVSAPVADLALWVWTRGGGAHRTGEQPVIDLLDAVVTQGM